MKTKKHLEKDLNQQRGLFFAIAIVFVMAFIYMALEWKSAVNHHGYDIKVEQRAGTKKNDSSFQLETKAIKKPSTKN